MTDFGTDIDMPGGDVSPLFALTSSPGRCLGQALARRFITKRGTLVDDPGYGRDLRELLNADLDADQVAILQSQIAAEAEADERVLAATAVVNLTFSSSSLSVRLSVETADGPFDLTLEVSALTVVLLEVTP